MMNDKQEHAERNRILAILRLALESLPEPDHTGSLDRDTLEPEELGKNKARCDWQLPLGNPEEPNAYVEQWQFARGKIAIIMVSARQMGWDIFTPGSSGLIVGTLEDAEKRLGIGGETP